MSSRSDLRRMYGFFRCTGCGQTWESSHVYCNKGSFTAQYQQQCKNCSSSCLPYRVERLTCSMCGLKDCICSLEDKAKRHTDANKPHRSDLCEKCKRGYPCTGGY